VLAERTFAKHLALSAAVSEDAYLCTAASLHGDADGLEVLSPVGIREEGLELARHLCGHGKQMMERALVVEIAVRRGKEDADRPECDE